VLIVDQENGANLGGQAFLVRSAACSLSTAPEQTSAGCARQSRNSRCRIGLAPRRSTGRKDYWPRQWGARPTSISRAGEKAQLAARQGIEDLPAGRLGPSAAATAAQGHGNSVPRFHITWGNRARRSVEIFARAGWSSTRTCGSPTGNQVDELIVEGRVGDRGPGALCWSRSSEGAAGVKSIAKKRSGEFEFRGPRR